jgi:hypothetical protein
MVDAIVGHAGRDVTTGPGGLLSEAVSLALLLEARGIQDFLVRRLAFSSLWLTGCFQHQSLLRLHKLHPHQDYGGSGVGAPSASLSFFYCRSTLTCVLCGGRPVG